MESQGKITENIPPREKALRALVVKHVSALTAAAIKERRADLGEVLGNGDRIVVTAPDDPTVGMGMVYRTNPEGTAKIHDRVVFTAWMSEHYPDHVQTVPSVAPSDMGEVIQVLRRHAPYLVRDEVVVMPWAERDVLALTVKARAMCGPGGETTVPGVVYEPPGPGVVTVVPSKEAPEMIRRLWYENRIDLESGEVRDAPAITGGDND